MVYGLVSTLEIFRTEIKVLRQMYIFLLKNNRLCLYFFIYYLKKHTIKNIIYILFLNYLNINQYKTVQSFKKKVNFIVELKKKQKVVIYKK
jgi:hypothetical protein